MDALKLWYEIEVPPMEAIQAGAERG